MYTRMKALGSLCVIAIVLTGCSSGPAFRPDPKPTAVELAETAPEDFAIAVTVYSVMTDRANWSTLPRPRRPARYVLEPDGVLRAAVGPSADRQEFPPVMRELSPSDVEDIWRLVQTGGLFKADLPGIIGSPRELIVRRSRPTAMVELAGAGERRLIATPLATQDTPAPELERVIDRLAMLAWQPQ
ncbi:MAG: hypothetical protein H6815_03265 [Phycisphaeraceae bacterium]|nr:hypothetical protein [Phycisphaerales bacterium]MCB9859447.1 hypothetical protein [Phycisphaeraceae bacterium]